MLVFLKKWHSMPSFGQNKILIIKEDHLLKKISSRWILKDNVEIS